MRGIRESTLVAALIILTSCAGVAKPGVPQDSIPAQETGVILLDCSLPALPRSHEVNAVVVTTLSGKDTFDQSLNAIIKGEALELPSEANELAWGIWEFSPWLESIQDVQVVVAVDDGDELYIALGDYSRGVWDIKGPLSISESIVLDEARHRSPAGNVYIAAITFDGHTATVHTLVLTTEDGWVIVTVDDADQVGWHSSLAVVNGTPAISYYDITYHNLKYAYSATSTGASQEDWSATVADGNSQLVGEYTSLAVVEGQPAISYYDSSNGALKYARSTGAMDSWGRVTVDTGEVSEDVGTYSSLAVVYGTPLITYYDSTNRNLKHAQSFTSTGTNAADWHAYIIDNNGDVGKFTSLAKVVDVAAVSYYDDGNRDLKYKWFSNPAKVTVASAGLVGTGSSLAVVNGNPAISYYDASNANLMYAFSSTTQGTSPSDWQRVTVDDAGMVGKLTSLAVISGRPAITYWDESNTNLKFAWATTATGADPADWRVTTVDRSGSVGVHTSLAAVDGKPAISYYDYTNADLKYAIHMGQ
jgi:hypothetical protein